MAEASPLHVRIVAPKIGVTDLEAPTMNFRLAAMAPLCREAVLPVLVLACIAASGFVPSANIAAPTVGRLAQSLTADAKSTDAKSTDVKLAGAESTVVKLADAELDDAKPDDAKVADAKVTGTAQPTEFSTAAVETVSGSSPATATSAASPVANEPDPIVTAALTDSSALLPPKTPQNQPPQTAVATEATSDANRPVASPDSIEIVDECLVVD